MNSKIDNGEYRYFTQGAPADVRETWSRSRRADGARITRSDRHARGFGTHIAVETVEPQDGEVTHAVVRWLSSGSAGDVRVEAAYRLNGTQLSVSRSVNGVNEAPQLHQVPATALLAPLMRIYMGGTLRRLAALGEATVIVPDIRDPANVAALLNPLFETRSARMLGREPVRLGDVEHDATRYEYLGSQYDAHAAFWLDEAGRMLCYAWRDWRVELVVKESYDEEGTPFSGLGAGQH